MESARLHVSLPARLHVQLEIRAAKISREQTDTYVLNTFIKGDHQRIVLFSCVNSGSIT